MINNNFVSRKPYLSKGTGNYFWTVSIDLGTEESREDQTRVGIRGNVIENSMTFRDIDKDRRVRYLNTSFRDKA